MRQHGASTAVFPTFWRVSFGDCHQFIAWAGGPKALALLGRSEAELVAPALEALSRVLDVSVEAAGQSLDGFNYHDFSGDPFIRRAYSYVRPGGTDAARELAVPAEETLFFAGEGRDSEHAGTVAGTIASGLRAAGEVVARLVGTQPPARSFPASCRSRANARKVAAALTECLRPGEGRTVLATHRAAPGGETR